MAHLVKVGVFGDYDEFVFGGVSPDNFVVRFEEAEGSHMRGVGEVVGQKVNQLEREVLIE